MTFITVFSSFNLITNYTNTEESYILPKNQSISDVPSNTQNLAICFYGNELEQVHFSPSLSELKVLLIGNECFQKACNFVIDGLPNLECVIIGTKCFCIKSSSDDGICRITNCPHLTKLRICDRCFASFKSLELSNLNSLQSITFGWNCFQYTDFSLKGE